MDAATRIAVFRGLLESVGKIRITEVDKDFEIVYSNVPHSEINALFMATADKELDLSDEGVEAMGGNRLSGPALFTNALGMSWISESVIENEKFNGAHLLGPVFLDDYSMRKIEAEIAKTDISVALKKHFMDVIKDTPIVSWNRFYEYGIMLHYALTGEKISVQKFAFPDLKPEIMETEHLSREANGHYLLENQLLALVEEGNLNYDQEMKNRIQVGRLFPSMKNDYLREAKDAVIVSCALCARAAVKGGLAADTAYLLRTQYISKIEDADTFAKVNEINKVMLDDFVRRVHRAKIQSGISPQIKETCDFICMHLDKKVDIHMLAARLGYTDYYFSNKFKKETGQSVRDYMMDKKIEKACDLLENTSQDVASIGMALGFGTQSYFGEVFRKRKGMSPGEYRLKFKGEQ